MVTQDHWKWRYLIDCVRDRIRNDTVVTVRSISQQEESLVQKIRKRRLTWFGHVTSMEGERLPHRALHCHLEGERSQGRQPKTWTSCIKEDVAEQDKSMQQTVELTRDIDAWRIASCRHHHHRKMMGDEDRRDAISYSSSTVYLRAYLVSFPR